MNLTTTNNLIDPSNPIISKIRKLMTTSADAAATPEEANTALQIAQRLMAVHRITEQQVAAHARGERVAAGDVRAEDLSTQVLGRWRGRQDGWLGMAVAEACGCDSYRSWGSVWMTRKSDNITYAKAIKQMVGFGLPTDLAVAAELFAWVQEKMRAETRAFCAARGGLPVTSVTGRSFADGFALALLDTARADKKARQKSTETVVVEVAAEQRVLVLISDAEASLDRALAVKAKQLGVGKSRRSLYVDVDAAARVAGHASGRSVNLSREVIR